MKSVSGLALIEEILGTGPPASKGDRLVYNFLIYLNKGEEVSVNEIQEREKWSPGIITERGGKEFINFTCTLGKREAVAAIEYSLFGMRVGGYRKVKSSPHLAFREQGIPGKVPPNAVLSIEIWLLGLTCGT